MSDTATDRRADDLSTADDGLIHLECCVNPDLSLCGDELTGEYCSEGDGSCCVVCEDVWRGGTCPAIGRCIDGCGLPA